MKNKNAVNKIKCHFVLDTESSTLSVSQRPQQALKMPNQIQHDGPFYTRGFTLIELLVVVLIIGILAAVALPQYQKTVEKARAAEALSIMKTIADANRVYHMAQGTHALHMDELDIEIPGTSMTNFDAHRVQTKWFEYGVAWDNDPTLLAIANRLPLGTFYVLNLFDDNVICCFPHNAKGTDFCKFLSKGKTNSAHSGCYQIQ